MNTNTAAVRILALALLGCSISRAVGARIGHPHTPQITIHGDTPDPDTGRYVKSYGEHILITCFSKTSNLTIRKDGIPQHVTVLNNTVQLYEENPHIGTYTYSCSDSENHDSLTVSIKPAMFLKSENAQHKFDQEFGLHKYFVRIGKNYEVFCNGDNVESLRILLNNNYHIPLQIKIVNETTLKVVGKANKEWDKSYFCKSKTKMGQLHEMIVVSSGYFPDAQDFQCIILSSKEKKEIECSWMYATYGDSFKLYYTDHNRGDYTVLLCMEPFTKLISMCKVQEYSMRQQLFYLNHNVTFTLSSCNEFVCNNQTFGMNTNAIMQQPPLADIDVLETSQRSAVLAWEKPRSKCVYKVQYRLKDYRRWLEANTSSVRCNNQCEYEIVLPYPNVSYMVTVQYRLEESVEDLWSDHVVAFLDTKPKPKCTCKHQTPVFPVEKILCDACTLSEDVVKKSLALIQKIKSIKDKLRNVNELNELHWKKKQINDKIDSIKYSG